MASAWCKGVLEVPQLTAPASVQALPLLPSFLYLPHRQRNERAERNLPAKRRTKAWWVNWHASAAAPRPCVWWPAPELAIATLAWIGAPLLPADAPPEVERIAPRPAPVTWSTCWAWEEAHPEAPLAQQQVTVTIPASFDPAARELTATACQQAGLAHFSLLEEPQAALYSWLQASQGAWREAGAPWRRAAGGGRGRWHHRLLTHCRARARR